VKALNFFISGVHTIFMGQDFVPWNLIFLFSLIGPIYSSKIFSQWRFVQFNNYLSPTLVESVIGLENNPLNCIVFLW
jgi:hypothetical protein